MPESELKIGVDIFPPFVIEEGSNFKGFEIELWGKVAKEINVSFSYIRIKFQELIPALADRKIDMGIAGLTLTEDRENIIDFSHTTFNSGLHILVPHKTRVSIFSAIKSLFTKEIRNTVLLLIGFVLVVANVIWFVEKNGNGTLGGPYWPGIFNAIWWAFETVSTIGYGDYTPVTLIGRIIGMLVILSGLAIFGLYIGQISSAITLKKLRSDISSVDDLKGKKVATVASSVSENVLQKIGAVVISVAKIHEAYIKLDAGEIDAVVFDAPVLLNYANNEGRGKVTIVGGLFERQNYGFGLQQNSPLSEKINRAILKIYESGEYARLYKKWFGEEY